MSFDWMNVATALRERFPEMVESEVQRMGVREMRHALMHAPARADRVRYNAHADRLYYYAGDEVISMGQVRDP